MEAKYPFVCRAGGVQLLVLMVSAMVRNFMYMLVLMVVLMLVGVFAVA